MPVKSLKFSNRYLWTRNSEDKDGEEEQGNKVREEERRSDGRERRD